MLLVLSTVTALRCHKGRTGEYLLCGASGDLVAPRPRPCMPVLHVAHHSPAQGSSHCGRASVPSMPLWNAASGGPGSRLGADQPSQLPTLGRYRTTTSLGTAKI